MTEFSAQEYHAYTDRLFVKTLFVFFLIFSAGELFAEACEDKGLILLGEITYLKKTGDSFEKKSLYEALEKSWNGNSNFYKKIALSGNDELPDTVTIIKKKNQKVLKETSYSINQSPDSRATIEKFSFMRDLYSRDDNLPIKIIFLFKKEKEKFCETQIDLERAL